MAPAMMLWYGGLLFITLSQRVLYLDDSPIDLAIGHLAGVLCIVHEPERFALSRCALR